jgi:hypothetical protein
MRATWREEFMSKKSSKKAANQLVPGQESKHASAAYPVEQAELDAQNARLKKAALAGAGALKPPAAQPPTEAAPGAKPLPMAETLRPSSDAPKAEPTLPQAAASPSQKAAIAATAPKTPVAPASTPLKPAAQPKPTKEQQKPALAERTQLPADPSRVKVTFALLEPAAKHVSVRGDFNGWSPDATPMKRHDDGHWETSVSLAPGRYEYKFFVDGQWVPDPLARENVWNHHGTLNSIVVV